MSDSFIQENSELIMLRAMSNVFVEKMDPVGQEDGDVDNDGDQDKSDKYLLKRRKAIGDAIKRKKKVTESVVATTDEDEKEVTEKKVKNKVTINPEMKEGYDKPDEKLKTDRDMFNIPKDEQKAARQRILDKALAKRKKVDEAKVDAGLDDEGKENARNYRKFGTNFNQHKTSVLRRSLHRSRRGDKKVKGSKVVEATYPSDFINPDGSKRAVAKKKYGMPKQHDEPTRGGRRKTVDE